MSSATVDPYVWVVRDTVKKPQRRHLRTCWHFYDSAVPVLATPAEMARLAACGSCVRDVERGESALQIGLRIARAKRSDVGGRAGEGVPLWQLAAEAAAPE